MSFVATTYARGYAMRRGLESKAMCLVLAAGRLSKRHIDRKADLLIQGLDCRDGGYLAGYLLVKQLWQHVILRSDIFFDRDFFLLFLATSIFHDWNLVDALLSEEKSTHTALQTIVNRVISCLKRLLDERSIGEVAREFERRVLSEESESFSVQTAHFKAVVFAGAAPWNSDVQASKDRMSKEIDALFREGTKAEFPEFDFKEMSLHSVFSLGSMAVTARRTENRLELHHGSVRVGSVPKEHVNDGQFSDGRLDVDVVARARDLGLCIVGIRSKEIVFCLSAGGSQSPSEFADIYLGLKHRRRVVESWPEVVEMLADGLDRKRERETMRESIDMVLNRHFIPMALLRVSDENLRSVSGHMGKDGFLHLLDGNLDLVRDAAAASLWLHSRCPLSMVDAVYQWSGGNALDSIRHINQLIRPQLGFFPFPERNGSFAMASFI